MSRMSIHECIKASVAARREREAARYAFFPGERHMVQGEMSPFRFRGNTLVVVAPQLDDGRPEVHAVNVGPLRVSVTGHYGAVHWDLELRHLGCLLSCAAGAFWRVDDLTPAQVNAAMEEGWLKFIHVVSQVPGFPY